MVHKHVAEDTLSMLIDSYNLVASVHAQVNVFDISNFSALLVQKKFVFFSFLAKEIFAQMQMPSLLKPEFRSIPKQKKS